jgi:hypothetical protein
LSLPHRLRYVETKARKEDNIRLCNSINVVRIFNDENSQKKKTGTDGPSQVMKNGVRCAVEFPLIRMNPKILGDERTALLLAIPLIIIHKSSTYSRILNGLNGAQPSFYTCLFIQTRSPYAASKWVEVLQPNFLNQRQAAAS